MPARRSLILTPNAPLVTLIVRECCVRQRRPERRSTTHCTSCDGSTVPVTLTRLPARILVRSSATVMRGITSTRTGLDSTRGRGPSPPNTARNVPLVGGVTVVVQPPSGEQPVAETGDHAEP